MCIYMPNDNTNGTISVPAQHQRFIQDNNDDCNPREAFREDLAKELEEWINAGDQILIGGDVNTEVTHSSIQDIFTEHHMRNAIYKLHDTIKHQESPKYYICKTLSRLGQNDSLRAANPDYHLLVTSIHFRG